MKATAKAPANIAFIKYWGKADASLRLPANSSFSMNLSEAHTTTTVEFSVEYQQDIVELLLPNKPQNKTQGYTVTGFTENEQQRIRVHLDRIRSVSGISLRAKVVSRNSFPKGAGIASSASGFAALTVASCAAAGLQESEKGLTILARLGSGSACRSIPDGFVLWEKGNSSDTSYAHSLFPHDYWDIRDILLVTDSSMKKVSTTDGHANVSTSPSWNKRLAGMEEKISLIVTAFKEKNFDDFGTILEEESLSMHRVMQTQIPPLIYWNETTRMIMDTVRVWRNTGLPVYFTIDAGPNVHLICEGKDEGRIVEKVNQLSGIQDVMINKPSAGACLITTHLF